MGESANKSVKIDCAFFFYGMKYAEICIDRLSTAIGLCYPLPQEAIYKPLLLTKS